MNFHPRRVGPGAIGRWWQQVLVMLAQHFVHFAGFWLVLVLVDMLCRAWSSDLGIPRPLWGAMLTPVAMGMVLWLLVMIRSRDGQQSSGRSATNANKPALALGALLISAIDGAMAWLALPEADGSGVRAGDFVVQCALALMLLHALMGVTWSSLCLFQGVSIGAGFALDSRAIELNPWPMLVVGLIGPAGVATLGLMGVSVWVTAAGFIVVTLLIYQAYLDIFEHRGLLRPYRARIRARQEVWANA